MRALCATDGERQGFAARPSRTCTSAAWNSPIEARPALSAAFGTPLNRIPSHQHCLDASAFSTQVRTDISEASLTHQAGRHSLLRGQWLWPLPTVSSRQPSSQQE